MTPLFISKATSNLSEFTDFYTAALGASVTYRQDRTSVLRSAFFNVGFESMAGHMSVRAVERPADAAVVRQLEAIKFAGHDWVHDQKANLSANILCGFDKWSPPEPRSSCAAVSFLLS